MHSMTGYGRSTRVFDGREITVEIKSVNHRFLDLATRFPRSILFLEDEARKVAGECFTRGHLDIFANYVNHRMDAQTVKPDMPLAHAYYRSMEEISASLGIPNNVTLRDIALLPDVMTVTPAEEDQEMLRRLFREVMYEACNQLKDMRAREGEKLTADLLIKLQGLAKIRDEIEERAPLVLSEYREKLHQKLQALLGGEIDDTRFNMEVVMFADRSSIDEELVRLKSHIIHCEEAFQSHDPVGRKLDFLIQEMNREANTMGSKASDPQIADAVVRAKGEIEKIREQIQNIE